MVEDSSSILVNKEYNDDEESVKTRMTAMVVGRVGRRRRSGNNRRPIIATIAALTTGILLLLVLTIISTTSITTKDSGAVENNNHHDKMKRSNGLRDESQQHPPYTTHYDHHAKRATETLAHWHRSLSSSASSSSSSAGGYDMKGLRPLDLVLDDPTTVLLYDDGSTSGNGNTNEGSIRQTPLPKVYQRGDGGFLEPYDFNNYQSNEERIDVSYGLAHDDNTDVVEDDDDEEEEETIVVVVPDEHVNDNTVTANHVMKERIGITNLDIIHRGVHHTPLPRDLEEVNERRKLLNQEKNDRELLLVSSSSSSTTANLVLHWCGTSHEDAASKCGKHCRKGHGCPTGEFCFGVGNVCDWKLEEIEQKRLDKLKDKNKKEDEREEDEEKQKKSNKKDDDRDKEIEQDKKKMKQRTDTLKDRNSKKKQRDKESDDDNKSTKKKRIKSNDDDKSTKKKRIKSKNDDVDDKSPKNEQRIKSKNDNDSDSSLNAMGYVSANVNKDKDDDYNKKRGYEIINGNIHVDIQPVNRRRLRRRDVKNNNKDDEQDIVRLLKRREEETFDFTHHDMTKKSYYESAIVDTDTSPPVVRSTFPPSNTTIGPRQTFGALVSDHALSYTSGVEKVCVQFRDALGVRSTCLPLYNVGSGASSTTSESGATSDVKCTKAEHRLSVDCLSSSSSSSTSRTGGSKSDIWERTFDGFGAFAGTAWKYRIQAYDTRKNRIVTKWQIFNIDARAEVTTTTTTTTTTSTIAAATTTTSTIGSSTTNCGEGNVGNGICPMAGDCCSKWGYCGVTSDHCGRSSTPATKLVDVVMDENWPHGGKFRRRFSFFQLGPPYSNPQSLDTHHLL